MIALPFERLPRIWRENRPSLRVDARVVRPDEAITNSRVCSQLHLLSKREMMRCFWQKRAFRKKRRAILVNRNGSISENQNARGT